MAVLRVIEGLNPGQVIPLAGAAVVLGRHPDCDVVLDHGPVSRQHARIVRSGDQFFLEDLHSRNHTYLNDVEVKQPCPLAENDRVKICNIVFSFHLGAPVPESTAAGGGPGVVLVEDENLSAGSTIMSKLDVRSGSSGLRLSVNAEVKLRALVEIGRSLAGAIKVDEILPKVLDNLFTIFIQADRGFVLLKDPASDRMIPKAVKHRRDGDGDQIRMSRTILRGVLESKEAILSADAATDSRFDMSESIVDFQIHSLMCAPLLDSQQNVLGVIQIDTLDHRRRFLPDDLGVLASVAGQAAMAIENAQLNERRLLERLLQRELELAHTVQQGLLPAGPPKLPTYQFCDFYEPAQQLGGDYFDYVPLSGGRLAIAQADVSGKGIAASLLMARLSADVRYCLASCPTPADAVARLNDVFCQSRWEGRFITFAVAVLDPLRHDLRLVNAGHMLPLVYRASGAIEELGHELSGLPLGVDAGTQYQEVRVALGRGDHLTFYTDGVVDAENAALERYKSDRLKPRLLRESQAPDLDDPTKENLARRILRDVRQFIGAHPQADDMCMTCVRRLE